jgi:hypothetical protein
MSFSRSIRFIGSSPGADSADFLFGSSPDGPMAAQCRTGPLSLKQLTSGRLFGYLARRPGNRATTARCPRGRAGTHGVQVVGARSRYRREVEQ